MPEISPVPTKRIRRRSLAGSSQTVQLASGGSVTLSGDFNLFSMSNEDFTFVSELASKLRTYSGMAMPMRPSAKVS